MTFVNIFTDKDPDELNIRVNRTIKSYNNWHIPPTLKQIDFQVTSERYCVLMLFYGGRKEVNQGSEKERM